MSRLGAFLILALAFVGFVAVPASHADYRKVFKAPAGYFKKTQYLQVRERTIREYEIGYDKHSSPRVRVWYKDIFRISKANQLLQLQQIFAITNARIKYQRERTDHWATVGESLARGYGDCDDFVAAYLTAAVLLGYKKKGLWWLVGYVNSRRDGRIGHAIAIIVLDDDSVYILDNRARRVIPMSEYFLLDPVYGINLGDREIWTGILVDSVGRPRRAY